MLVLKDYQEYDRGLSDGKAGRNFEPPRQPLIIATTWMSDPWGDYTQGYQDGEDKVEEKYRWALEKVTRKH